MEGRGRRRPGRGRADLGRRPPAAEAAGRAVEGPRGGGQRAGRARPVGAPVRCPPGAEPARQHTGGGREGRDGTSPVGKPRRWGKSTALALGWSWFSAGLAGRGRRSVSLAGPCSRLAGHVPAAGRAGGPASLPPPQVLFRRRRPRPRSLHRLTPASSPPASSSGTLGSPRQNSAGGGGGGGGSHRPPPAARPPPSRRGRGAVSAAALPRCRPARGGEGAAERWVSSLATSPLVLLCGVGGVLLGFFCFVF